MSCEGLVRVASDEAKMKLLTDWSDENVFKRNLQESDLWRGWLVGPGRLGSLRPELMENFPRPLVADLSFLGGGGLEARVFGGDRLEPDSLFFGSKADFGVFVLRDRHGLDFDAIGLVESEHLRLVGSRVAVSCYLD